MGGFLYNIETIQKKTLISYVRSTPCASNHFHLEMLLRMITTLEAHVKLLENNTYLYL